MPDPTVETTSFSTKNIPKLFIAFVSYLTAHIKAKWARLTGLVFAASDQP